MKKHLIITACDSWKTLSEERMKVIMEQGKLLERKSLSSLYKYEQKRLESLDIELLRIEKRCVAEYKALWDSLDSLEELTFAKTVKAFFIVKGKINFKKFFKLINDAETPSLALMKACANLNLRRAKLEKLLSMFPIATTFAYSINTNKKEVI